MALVMNARATRHSAVHARHELKRLAKSVGGAMQSATAGGGGLKSLMAQHPDLLGFAPAPHSILADVICIPRLPCNAALAPYLELGGTAI